MEAPPKIQLTITVTPGQPVQVTGPLVDKMLCYGLLEMARDVIQSYDPNAQQRLITVPRMKFGNGAPE